MQFYRLFKELHEVELFLNSSGILEISEAEVSTAFKKSAYTFRLTCHTKTKCRLSFCNHRCCLWLRTDRQILFSAVCLINPQGPRAVVRCFSLTHLSAWLISLCLLICLQQYWRCSLWGSWLLKLEEAFHCGRSCDIINYVNLYRCVELYGPNFNEAVLYYEVI